jgi:8-oxo-dGTP diphosphatase
MTSADPQIAVGAIVIREGKLLMVQRGRDPGAGLWSVPGGRVQAGEYLSDALKREVLEETGLEIDVGGLIGLLEVLGPPHYVILDFGAHVIGESTEPQPADDASDARWVPIEEIEKLDCTPRFVESLRGWGVLP